MNIETHLLNTLKAKQQTYALEALKRPQARDSFEYGFRAGTIAGLEAAIEVLLTLIDEQKNGNNDI